MKSINEILNSDSTEVIKNEEFLRVPCENVTIEEGEEIAAKLFRVLTDRGDGYGLAANQIGIQKRVCALNVKSPIYLINPKIVESSGELIYYERCLSFPGQVVRTKRYSNITVECDNIEGQLYFDVSGIPETDRGLDNIDITEIVAVQHEISHLDGKTMFDFRYSPKPIKKEKSIGRNEKVKISNGTETIDIKYKFLQQYEQKGYKLI